MPADGGASTMARDFRSATTHCETSNSDDCKHAHVSEASSLLPTSPISIENTNKAEEPESPREFPDGPMCSSIHIKTYVQNSS